MKKTAYLFLLSAIISCTFSLPRFALRSGAKCIDCHVNPTGGEMRTTRGWNVSKKWLSMVRPGDDFEMSNKLTPNVSFGFDFRGQLLGAFMDSVKRLDFQKMAGSVYGNVAVSKDIDIYGRYDFVQQIWEGYAVARILPSDGYIKGGSFVPNFGIRTDDHTAYTRGGDMGLVTTDRLGLIYDPYYTESGVEAGIGITDYAYLTASVGTPPRALFTTDPSYTASLQIFPVSTESFNLFLGGSYANFKKQRFNNVLLRSEYPTVNMYGGFMGIGISGFTLLAEYDIADNYIVPDQPSTALMIEGAYNIMHGFDAVIRYDRFDVSTDADSNEVSRLVLGFEIFPYSFVEIRPQYRLQMEKPSIDNNSLVVQVHLFY